MRALRPLLAGAALVVAGLIAAPGTSHAQWGYGYGGYYRPPPPPPPPYWGGGYYRPPPPPPPYWGGGYYRPPPPYERPYWRRY